MPLQSQTPSSGEDVPVMSTRPQHCTESQTPGFSLEIRSIPSINRILGFGVRQEQGLLERKKMHYQEVGFLVLILLLTSCVTLSLWDLQKETH